MPSTKYANFDASDDEFITSSGSGGSRFDVVFRGGSTVWRERSLLEKLLVIAVGLLLIMMVVFTVLLATSHHKIHNLQHNQLTSNYCTVMIH